MGRLLAGAAVIATALSASSAPANAALVARSLTELQVSLYGLSASVEPASPIVPKQTASGLRIVVKAGAKTLSASEVERLLGGPFEVQAELSGPGLTGALALPRTGADAIPSPDPLVLTFPGLPHAGEYDLSNIRLVRSGRPVLDVLPRRVTLRVIEQILVTSVVTRPLTLDEIRERGVVLDASAYLGFEFAVTLRLESTPVSFRFPVVFDREGVPMPMALEPPPEPLRSVVSAPQLVPVLLRPVASYDDPDGAPPDYGFEPAQIARIPSLLVIPGSVGYLKQFFSAQLMVGNGAPVESGLVVSDVTGTLRLPPGADGQAGTADDPLALPALEAGPQSMVLEVRGDDGTGELLPGEFGRGELTLRGEREGRHDVDFDIRATLGGLPVGPVPLAGTAHGVVLVRNAYFDVTFTVPTVVRADEEFSVFATVTNIGQGTGNDVKMTLDAARLSGARLLSAGTQAIDSLAPGDAATLEYRFRSEVTGEVVASYLRFETSGGVDVSGRLNFTLGVGERGVALSPDTLQLPSSVRALPTGVLRAAMRVLGQAWSAANATSLPAGVERPTTAAVFRKGLAVAEAGLRMELGQPLADSLRDLLLDLHGDAFDPGFDQVLRQTTAGRSLDRILGAALEDAVAGDALRFEEDSARIAASGAPFLSFAVLSAGGGALPAEPVIRDGQGRLTDAAERDVPGAVIVPLGADDRAPRLGWLATLGAPPYAIELAGVADGTIGLSVTLPEADGGARRARVAGLEVRTGSRHRLVYDPARAGELVLETDLAGDGVFERNDPVDFTPLDSEGPRLVAATTIGPETLDGASPFGTYAALLFDRVVSGSDAEDPSHYEIPDNSVLAAKRQLSGRLVFLALEQPEGPLVPVRLAVAGIRDERGAGGERQELALGSRLLLPGAVVSGRVLKADGSPVADTLVTYSNSGAGHGGLDCTIETESGIAAQRTDAAGRFAFHYVTQSPCGAPFRVETNDPVTGARRGVKMHVRAHGQHLSLDLVLVGHGRVEGQVRQATGAPAAGARVRVVSVADSQVAAVTTADGDGRYAVEGVTVGPVAVTAVLGANLGRGAGELAPGGPATVDVTLDGSVDITGVVSKLEGGVQTPVPGVDVVYYVDNKPLGLSVSDSKGQYRLLGVPAGRYRLEAGLNERDKTSLEDNGIAGQKIVKNLIIEVLDYSHFGTVKGTVKRFDGSPMPEAWVSDNVVATRADSHGRYELAGVALSASPRLIYALSPDGWRKGSTSVVLTVPGQVATADIQLSGVGAATFQVLDSKGAPVSGASVGLQGNCVHPCGCRFETTDEQGMVLFRDLQFGPWSARAVLQTAGPAAWDTATSTAVINSEDAAAGAVIQLGGFGSVSGLVRNPDGKPAHGASVELNGPRVVVGPGVCSLQTTPLGTVNTDASGAFRFDGVHVGQVFAGASSVVFPSIVKKNATLGEAGGTTHFEFQLVDTMAGLLSGTVWLPDGASGAGPDVEVTASSGSRAIPDVTVRTDAQGRYSFAHVLPAGGYLLTARDTRPAGTGSVVQIRVWLQPAQPARHDLRLKAKGPVRVNVVDGAGVPVADTAVRVKLLESDFPHRAYERTINGAGDQPLEFPAVYEGAFSIVASDGFGRGGRASGSAPPLGQPVEIKVQLTTTGRVAGHFLWADRTTPLPFGTVSLNVGMPGTVGERAIGQQTTAGEGDIGSYAFEYVPAGTVRLEAQDPRTGRTGVATGSLTDEGQLLTLDVVARAAGRVEGDVTLNGQPAPGAEVSLRSGAYRVRVTADGAGHYAVEGVPEGLVQATADLGGGFLAGTAQGALAAEGETLDLPISLRDAGRIEGRLVGGTASLVTISSGGRTQATTTAADGSFRFDLVPEGPVEIVADALASIDCARDTLNVVGGETLEHTLTLRGVGALEGTARASSGPVGGRLILNGTGAGCAPKVWDLQVAPGGSFRIPELVAGPVSATFYTRPSHRLWLEAKGTAMVARGQTTTLDLVVEPSGTVRGRVVHEDGTPAIGSQVTLFTAAGEFTIVQTGGDGWFVAQGIPAGLVTISVRDPARAGVALVTGKTVVDNATLEVGEVPLVETPFAVVSFTPSDGATNVGINQVLQLTFNAPVSSMGNYFGLRAGSQPVGSAFSVSTDQRTVTITRASGWPDSSEITLEVWASLTDVYGRRLGETFRSRFRTVDLSPPRVIAVAPAHQAIQVVLGTSISVQFDERLATAGNLQGIVRLSSPLGQVAGVVTSPALDSLLFTPSAPLASNLTYTVTVNGATDLMGRVQTKAFTSSFMTLDGDPPLLRLDAPPPGAWTKEARPTIRVSVSDALAGPDASRAQMRLDGVPVSLTRSSNQVSHTPKADLADGPHNVEASAHDRAGNQGNLAASFRVDTQPPTRASVTSPASDQVVSNRVTLAGTADDAGSGVARLNFLRDGQWIAEGTAANGLTATWDTAGSSEGPHLITAHAVDVAGNSGPASLPARVIVNNQPLAVSITSPDAVKAHVSVTASPSEPVLRVEFRAASQPPVIDETAPYEAAFDVSAEPEGSLELSVTAVGVAPETAIASRTIFVDRTPPAAPDPTRVHAEATAGSALILGLPGAAEEGSLVRVVNTATSAANERSTFDGGSVAMRVPATVGDVLAVTASDVAGNESDPLAIAVVKAPSEEGSVSPEGLSLWARSGDGVTVDGSGRASRWEDRSGHGNHLVTAIAPQRPGQGTDPVSGLPVLRFDGTDDWMKFTTPLEGTIRAVFAVLRQNPRAEWQTLLGHTTATDFLPYSYKLWHSTSSSRFIREGETWLNGRAVDGTKEEWPATISVLSVLTTGGGVTADRLAVGFGSVANRWKGDIGELLVYERPLSGLQRQLVEDYLVRRHALYVPTVVTPIVTPYGATFSGSIVVTVTAPTPGSIARYTVDGSEPSESSPLYVGPLTLTNSATFKARAFRAGHISSRTSVAGFVNADDSEVPSIPGLALWVRSDADVEVDAADRVSKWSDQSGQGNDLVQTALLDSQPVLTRGELNGLPVLRFDGEDDWMKFTTPLEGKIRAVFAVLRQNPRAEWQTLLGHATETDFRPGSHTLWHTTASSRFVREGRTWLDGVARDGTKEEWPTTMSVLSVQTTEGVTADRLFDGSAPTDNPWKGDIAELVIYTEPLTGFQHKAVEDYLRLKYKLQGTAGAPEFSPNGATFTSSVEVTLASPTPGAEIRYTTDGSDPDDSSPLYTNPLLLTKTITVKARAFRVGMEPSPVSAASFTNDSPVPNVPGLALWVRSDADVEVDAGDRVTKWSDQSGQGNHLVQTTLDSQPKLVRGEWNGLPVLRFDGTNDWMKFTTPVLGKIRAVFAVLKQNPRAEWQTVLGHATVTDFLPYQYKLWHPTSSSRFIRQGQTWLNGRAVDGTKEEWPAELPAPISVLSVLTTGGVTADRLAVGFGSVPNRWKGDIAELVIYTEPLTAFQHKAVEDYLRLKYALPGKAGAPEFSPNGATFTDSVEVTLASPTPGAEVHYTTDGSDPDESSPLYTSPLLLTETTIVKARAFRAGMDPSSVSLAAFTNDSPVPSIPGLALWVRSDAGVVVDAADRVSVWRDFSGQGNDLSQVNVPAQPKLVLDPQAALPVVRFDGEDDALSFKRLTTIRTVFWVVCEEPSALNAARFLLANANSRDFHPGAVHQIWSANASSSVLNGETRVNSTPRDGKVWNRPTSLSVISLVTMGNVSADAFGPDPLVRGPWLGDLAELVVYDRALTGAERKTIEDHLAYKYKLYEPTLPVPVITPRGSTTGEPVRVTISAAADAEVRYTTDGSLPTGASSLYTDPLDFTTRTTLKARAFRTGFKPSPVAMATFLDVDPPAPLKVAGLKLWVKADAGVTLAGASVSTWADQSGNGNDLVQGTPANPPQLVLEDADGFPVMRFDGKGDWLSFTSRLTTIRSVFWVIRRSAEMTPGYRFLLGDTGTGNNTSDFASGETTGLWSSTWTNAHIRNGQTRLDGGPVNGVATYRPTELSVISLVTKGNVTANAFSRDRNNDRSWWGDLAELVIYDRELSPAEVRSIEEYLAGRHGIGLAP